MKARFPQDVHLELARTLPPTGGFEPSGYFDDPARFELFNVDEIKKIYKF